MSQIIIDTGNVANDGTGSTLRQAFADVNSMFTEVYNAGPVSSNVSIANNTIATTLLNSNLILAPSGIGNVQANSRIVPGFNDVYDIGSPDKRWNTIYVGTGGLDIQGGLNFGGNVSANYFIGNGSQLTGIVAEASHQIANGTSNVNISTANGAVTVSINGTDNVAAFTQAAFYTETDIVANGAVSASGNLIGNYILGNGALLSGIPGGTRIANGTSNVAITTSGGNVTVSVGGVDDVALFTPTDIQLKGNVDILGTIVAPGFDFESGNLAVTGNISASYFTGNGSLLTGIVTDTSKKIANGTSNVNIATANGNVTVGVGGIPNVAIVTIGGISVTGQISATGNIAGGYFVGNGRQLTGITSGSRIASGTSNVAIDSPNGNVTVSVGGVDDVALFTPTSVQLKGNVGILGNIIAPGLAFESGNLALSGNVTAQYFIGNGGALTGISSDISKKIANGTSNVNIATASGNVTVGVGGIANITTITTSGISVTGQITTTGQISSAGNVTGGYFVGNGRQLTGITSGSRIASGNSNVVVESTNGDVTIGVDGVSNVAVFTPTDIQLKGDLDILGTIVAPGLDFESGNLSVIGNISAAYYYGNGRNLTGIIAANVHSVANGTSNVDIATANGNVTISVGGVPNVATFTTSGQNLLGSLSVTNSVTANVITANTSVKLGNTAVNWGTLTSNTTTANQTIATLTVVGVTGIEFLVKGIDLAGGKYSMATVQAVTNGSSVDYSTFGGVQLGGYTGKFAVNIIGSNISLQVTPASSNNTVWTTQYRII